MAAAPATTAATTAAARRSARAGATTAASTAIRGNMTVQAATTPPASVAARAGVLRARLPNAAVTAVEDTSPPTSPVTSRPRRPSRREAT